MKKIFANYTKAVRPAERSVDALRVDFSVRVIQVIDFVSSFGFVFVHRIKWDYNCEIFPLCEDILKHATCIIDFQLYIEAIST